MTFSIWQSEIKGSITLFEGVVPPPWLKEQEPDAKQIYVFESESFDTARGALKEWLDGGEVPKYWKEGRTL